MYDVNVFFNLLTDMLLFWLEIIFQHFVVR